MAEHLDNNPIEPTDPRPSRVEKQVLSMAEAAIYIGVDYDTFTQYVKLGFVQPVQYPSLVEHKIGKPRRTKQFRKQTLDRFIETSERPAPEAGTKVGTKGRCQTTGNYKKGWEDTVVSSPSKRR